MISRYSVKKPYTVVVAVAIVLILGYVAFTRMTTDLLPNMNLPYAIVITSYPGASPEEVESNVTVSIEEAMASINNIGEITSVSNENYSMVLLEFQESTNMDTATIDMRESLDELNSSWDNDSISSPIIMKLNPNMMPVMIAAIDSDTYSGKELTDLVTDEIIPDLESLEGIASVSATGNIEESVQVILRQDKIDTLNKKIQSALDDKFEDAEDEIKDGQSELESAEDELQSQVDELASKTADGEKQINENKSKLLTSKLDLKNQLSTVENSLSAIEEKEAELKKSEAELKTQKEALEKLPDQLKELTASLEQLETSEDLLYQIKSELAKLRSSQALLEGILSSLEEDTEDSASESLADTESTQAELNPDDLTALLNSLSDEQLAYLTSATGMTKEELAALIASSGSLSDSETDDADMRQELQDALDNINQQITIYEQQLQATGITDTSASGIDKKINELSAQKVTLQNTQKQLQEAVNSQEENLKQIDDAQAQITAGKTQLTSGKSQLKSAKKQLEDALKQIESGEVSLEDALAELNSQKLTATIEIAAAKAQIQSGKTQLEDAEEQLEDQKDSAYEQADADTIITIDTIEGLLTAQNFSMPAGYVTEDGIDYLIRVGDSFEDTDSLEKLVLMDMNIDGVDPIKLSDVADVIISDNSDEVYAMVNGNPGIMLSMQKQTDYSTGDVSERILNKFESLKTEYEEQGIHFITLMDQGVYIDMIINSVLGNLLWGALLAIIVLLIFLKDLRPTVIVAFSIPISLMTAVVFMYFSGVTLNIISLSGLALGVGMLVDNSIVVIENIYRMRSEGKSRVQAAVTGASQVTGAIIASTLTTVCVFAPIVFTEGITRTLFVDMGLTIAYSLTASLIVALTLVPMMSSGLLKNIKPQKQPILDRIQNAYGKAIPVVLRFKPVVLLGALALLFISAALSFSRGTALFPDMESTQISVDLATPEGTSLADTAKIADEAVSRISSIEDVEDVGAMTSSSTSSIIGMGGNTSTNEISIYVLTNENRKMSNDELNDAILEQTKDLDCTITVSTSSMDMSALGGSGISIEIKGKNLDKLQQIAEEIAAIVESVEGTDNVSDGIEETTDELRLIVNKTAATKYQLTTAQVYQAIYGKLADASKTTTISTDTYDYNVYVTKDTDEELTREKVKKLKITGKDEDGKDVEIPISKLVTFEDAEGLASINRSEQSRCITVTAEIKDGYNIGLVSNTLTDKLNAYEIADGYTWKMTGEDESINEAMGQIVLMLVMAIALMYLIMVAQFQSLLSPFIVMFTIPLAFTGGLLGLYLTGSEISIIAMIGFVMLAGVIVNNGIVMVDYINQLRQTGMEKKEAIKQAGMTRLRPIIMTALTTILALSTMVFSTDMGADMSRPMAIVTIGGLLYGTLLTLFVVPCIYDVLNRKKDIRREELNELDELQ